MKWYDEAPSKEPSERLLRELARALQEAEAQNVAGHILAGFLWACYPEWFDEHLRERKR